MEASGTRLTGNFKKPNLIIPQFVLPRAFEKRTSNIMIYLLVGVGVGFGIYIFLVETLFKSSKCKGNAVMAGRTVIITGRFIFVQVVFG